MEEMELLFPRAKKEVWVRRRVVRVAAVGVRSRRAVGVWGLARCVKRDGVDGRCGDQMGWLTEEEVLESEEEVEGYVLCFCLREQEERC